MTSPKKSTNRRAFVAAILGSSAAIHHKPAVAAVDCFTDCFQNCRAIAPKNLDYCQASCRDSCAQPDREDGLSGSVSSARGEVGILGGSFGQGTVAKGEDKPPEINLPGLDFSSSSGRKLIGYWEWGWASRRVQSANYELGKITAQGFNSIDFLNNLLLHADING